MDRNYYYTLTLVTEIQNIVSYKKIKIKDLKNNTLATNNFYFFFNSTH